MMSLLLAVSVANMTITRDDANLRFKALIYSSEWLKDWLCPIVYGRAAEEYRSVFQRDLINLMVMK